MNQLTIEQWLVSRVARTNGQPETEVDPELEVQQLGIDSTEAVVISGELQELCGVPVAPTVLFDHGTLRATAAAIAMRLSR